MSFLFGEVSSSSGCLGWATLFYCGTAFHIIILFTCNYVVSVRGGFLFLLLRYFIVAHPGLPYNYFKLTCTQMLPVLFILQVMKTVCILKLTCSI